MNKNKELVNNTLIITIGRISTQFISFVLLPLYTAFLTTEEYGIVDLIVTYTQLLLPVMILQMDQSLFRFMIKDRESEKNNKKCISTAYIFFVIQVAIFSLIYFLVTRFIYNEYAVYLYANIFATGLSSLMLQTARGFGDNITYSISSFICGALTICLNVIFIAGLKMHEEGMLLAAIIGNLVAALFIMFKKKVFGYVAIKSFDNKLLKQMLRYAWPLIPNALIWWMVNASDRSITLAFLGASANGILAVSHKFPTLIITVYNVFNLSWTESAALHLGEKDRNEFFSNVFDVIFRIFSSACIMLIAILPFIFDSFINNNYHEAYNQIPIFTLASLFNVVVGLYSVIYISEMNTGEIAKTSFFSGIINLVINLALVSWIGLYAASISSAVAFGIMGIYRAMDSRKYIKQKISYPVLLAIISCLIIGFVVFYSKLIILQIAYLFAATMVSAILNYDSLIKVLKSIKHKLKRS